MGARQSIRDELYREAAEEFSAGLSRLASAYEADPEKTTRPEPEYSLAVAAKLGAIRFTLLPADLGLSRRPPRGCLACAAGAAGFARLVSLEELVAIADRQPSAEERVNLELLSEMIQQLKPPHRQVIVSYLKDMDAASIGEITGLTPGNVAMRMHRNKKVLARRFHERGNHAE